MSRGFKGAVIGCSQAGKTAFINSMLELVGEQKLPEVENKDRGKVITSKSPLYALELSEIPEPEFIAFYKQRYFFKFDLKDYDFFVLFVEERSANIDMYTWLIANIEQKLHKPCYLVRSKLDIIFARSGGAMQTSYASATEEQKEAIRQDTFEKLRSDFEQHYLNKRVYLLGRENPNARLGLEFNNLLTDMERWRPLMDQMPPEEEPFYQVLKNKILNYVIATENTGQSLEDYSAAVIQMLEDEPLPSINGCVVGQSGVGKSSLINSFVGEYVAKEGVIQTTMDANTYTSLDPPLTITDIPGVGTREFPKEEYAARFNLAKYDFIIIMINPNERENSGINKWLQTQVKKELKRPCYLVRSFFDEAVVQKATQMYPTDQNFSEPQIAAAQFVAADDIRSRHKKETIFLVGKDLNSTTPKHGYEFMQLKEAIKNDLPKYLQGSLESSCAEFTNEWIEAKSALLTKYMIKYSVVSTSAGVCPVPGPSLAVDIALLTCFAKRCTDVFHLNGDSLKVLVSPERVAMFTTRVATSREASLALITMTSTTDLLKVVPVVGTILGGAVGCLTSGPFLYLSMYTLRKACIQILRDVLKESNAQCR